MASPDKALRIQFSATYVTLYLSLFVISSILIFVVPVGSSTEAREAHIISLLASGSDWVLPLRNGILPSKPPLYHWVGAALTLAFGDSAGVARLPSVIFGIATLWLTLFLALRLRRPADAQERSLQLLTTALVLLTSWGFLGLMLEARVDMTFAFWCTLSISLILRRFSSGFLSNAAGISPVTSHDFFWFYFSAGMAVLSRGPIGLILPVLISWASFAYISGARSATKAFLRPCLGWLVFLLVAIPWYVLAFLKGTDAFIWRQVVFENILRLSGGAHVNTEAVWFYIPSFLRSVFPWSVFFVLWGLTGIKNWRAVQRLDDDSRIRNIPLIWFIVGLIFFSSASGKRHSYLLPLIPAVAIYVGCGITEWVYSLSETKRRIFEKFFLAARWEWLLVLLLVAMECARLPTVFSGGLQYQILNWYRKELPLLELAILAALLFSVTWRIVSRGWGWSTALGNLLCFVTLIQVIAVSGLGIKNAVKGYQDFAQRLQNSFDITQVEIVKDRFDESFDALMYYLRRPIRVSTPEQFEAGCSAGQCFQYRLLRKDLLDQLQRGQPQRWMRFELAQTFSVSSKRFEPGASEEFVLVRAAE